MKEKKEQLVEKLRQKKQTICCMESCTGGLFASEITDVPHASEVLKVSLVTYSNEYKTKFGVSTKTIETYSVYSMQTANEMAKKACFFANSDWGVGITGQLGRQDPNNTGNKTNEVYYTIYQKEKNSYYSQKITLEEKDKRLEMKLQITEKVMNDFIKILDDEEKG